MYCFGEMWIEGKSSMKIEKLMRKDLRKALLLVIRDLPLNLLLLR